MMTTTAITIQTITTLQTEDEAFERAYALAKGSYQRDLVCGRRNMSGSDLKGAAKTYGGKYSASRNALTARLREAGIAFAVVREGRGAAYLQFGDVSWLWEPLCSHDDCRKHPELARACRAAGQAA